MNKLMKIGHRGAKGYLAENTIASFHKAHLMGCHGIEFDVHLSADDEVIVIHDETVDRTSDGTGFVRDLTLNELRKLRIDLKHQIPTLKEVLDHTEEFQLINIEIKAASAANPVVDLIEKWIFEKKTKYHRFLVSSFDWEALKQIRENNPSIPLGVLTQTDLNLAIGFSDYIKAETIHPYFHLLTSENTTRMQQSGFGVFPWTVNEHEDIARMKSFKVNGIISDFPDRL